MKKLLMVTLLLLLISAFASCNSYDVEGKPEVASNPAKKVFSYYPWGGNNNQQEKPDNETGDDEVANDDEVTDDAADNEVVDNETPDDVVVDDAQDDVVADEDNEVVSDDDTTIVFKNDTEKTDDSEPTDGNEPPADNNTGSGEDLTEVFEIYNRGVTGELKIAKINILDQDGNRIEDIENNNYKNLFKMQIQKTNGSGIADNTNLSWGSKVLTFDNLTADAAVKISSLCPLDPNNPGVCKESFKATKYNSKFKVLLTYSKNAAETLKNAPPADLKLAGDFAIEVCTNDTGKDKSITCPEGSSSYKIQITRQPNKPPKPIIHVTFDFTTGGPMSYRNIKDEVSMNLKETCVSDPEAPSQCLADWEERYYIKYKWEMKQSPTPLRQESALQLPDSSGTAGQWLADEGNDNPKRAEFTGLMVTPRRYLEDENPDFKESTCTSECGDEPTNTGDKFYFMDLSNFLLCRQKYCEKTKTRFYKVNIQAETVDKETDLVSDTAEITVVPKIIPQARVVAQLTWVEGFKTKTESESDKEGTKIDLDIHLIKRSSLEAGTWSYTPTDGVMCTTQQFEGMSYSPTEDLDNDGKPDYEKYFRHDDCHFADQGLEAVDGQNITETIAWNATFDLDNTWGGNNYENPETIGLGPIEDKDGDGKPDKQIIDDQYLVVVSYSYCTSKNFPASLDVDNLKWDTCCDPNSPDCNGDGSAHEVHARVDILIDGFEAARPERTQGGNVIRPKDNYSESSKLFTIKPDEWKVIAAIKWDGSLPGPESNPSYEGDAIVSDVPMTDEEIEVDAANYKTCKFDISLCELVPVWDTDAYYGFVSAPQNPADETSPPVGECY